MDGDRTQCFISMQNNLHYPKQNTEKDMLKITPQEVKFIFGSTNLKMQKKTVQIANYHSKSCVIQILPPVTHYFRINDKNRRKWLNPGSVCKVNISFTPDEPRDYHDVLKICCYNDFTLPIKIFASPTTDFTFPKDVDFGDVPIGRAAYREIPIHSHSEKTFSFAVLPSKEDPCVDIYPRWGHVRPKEKPVIITVIYRPLEYISMNFKVRLFISHLCKTPYTINFRAYTRPGLLREMIEYVEEEVKSISQPKKTEMVRRKKVRSIGLDKDRQKNRVTLPVTENSSYQEALLKKLMHLPLYTLHAVNCILNSQHQVDHGEYELRGPLNTYVSCSIEEKLKRRVDFLTKAEERRQENERARIHHKPKVNYGTSDAQRCEIEEILMERGQTWNNYQESMITSSQEELFERQEARKIRQRVLRTLKHSADTTSMAPGKAEGFLHYWKISLFLEAARKIVLNNRLLRNLEKLKTLTAENIAKFEDAFIE